LAAFYRRDGGAGRVALWAWLVSHMTTIKSARRRFNML
jgi:hypothetical protein